MQCPSCTLYGGGGAAQYRENIECCNTTPVACGTSASVDLNLQPGNMQGPTQQGTSCLIHEEHSGIGQDLLDDSVFPFTITGGLNNPNPSLVGQPVTSSSSVVTVPLYDGHQLCPGSSCTATVTVIGFLQVFIDSVDLHGNPQTRGNVNAKILNVAGCGSGGIVGGGGSTGAIGGGGASPIPIRLVHN